MKQASLVEPSKQPMATMATGLGLANLPTFVGRFTQRVQRSNIAIMEYPPLFNRKYCTSSFQVHFPASHVSLLGCTPLEVIHIATKNSPLFFFKPISIQSSFQVSIAVIVSQGVCVTENRPSEKNVCRDQCSRRKCFRCSDIWCPRARQPSNPCRLSG